MGEEFSKIFNKIGSNVSIIFSTLTSILGIEWTLFAGFLILNIIDFFTGITKAKIKKIESSEKGLLGIIKKIGYWILILVSFLISFLLLQIGYKINMKLDFIMIFGWFVLTNLIINEARSIIENLIEIGINVPLILKKGLECYEIKIENTIENLIEKK